MANIVIVGAQWGDEGKGKIVDLLSKEIEVVVRFQGGNNAGHTIIAHGIKHVLHLVPSGILHPGKLCLIGNGVVLDPVIFMQELEMLHNQGIDISPSRLKISAKTHLIMPYHKLLDQARENSSTQKIGTTGRGIGPCYEDKVSRLGVRLADLADLEILRSKVQAALKEKNILFSSLYQAKPITVDEVLAEISPLCVKLLPYCADISTELQQAEGKGIMFEGAQGIHLDIDHGTYPFVTSSNTVAGNAAAGSGLASSQLHRIMGILKAYTTRVGEGPFPTELHDDTGAYLRKQGGEFGATTGRPRRCGWQDLVILRESVRLNGLTEIALTKLDVLSGLEDIKVCVAYKYEGREYLYPPQASYALDKVEPIYESCPGWKEDLTACKTWDDLPLAARNFVERLESLVNVPITLVSVGPDRDQTIARAPHCHSC